jgi:hypothetical protein
MATIRENARYGTALWVVVTAGCVATDQPLFETVAAPELRADPVGGSAPSSAAPAAAPEPQPLAEQAPLPISLEPPVMALQAEALPSPEPPAPEPPPALPEPSVFEPCSSPGLLLCDTFEADAVGSFPAAEHWLDELPGCGTHRVGEVDVGPPSRALLSQQGGYPECMLHADLGEQADFYVRSRVRLGPEPELREQYLSLLEIGARAAQDEPELRVGSRPSGGSLCGNTPGLDVVSNSSRSAGIVCRFTSRAASGGSTTLWRSTASRCWLARTYAWAAAGTTTACISSWGAQPTDRARAALSGTTTWPWAASRCPARREASASYLISAQPMRPPALPVG